MDQHMPDVWRPGSKKSINPCTFDPVLIHGFCKALKDAGYSGFTQDLKLLKSNPGTMLGLLFTEMLSKNDSD